ncbi:exodeoxyribonuclease V alpha subunit [Pseudomonas nitritireducens]|uniref:Exodeoxyribonuclease V alpha subunit n=1 Tax=Pseudomonas nitroreducens TaxID=46680 RepID=A0A7W7NZI7_PSENT|nr:AAA family ATPase [Pseudomonas nitritireducens]MBB4861335.1 exodeoxyribonuclease V alpha subunit [Pseudomonas nitritireducens]
MNDITPPTLSEVTDFPELTAGRVEWAFAIDVGIVEGSYRIKPLREIYTDDLPSVSLFHPSLGRDEWFSACLDDGLQPPEPGNYLALVEPAPAGSPASIQVKGVLPLVTFGIKAFAYQACNSPRFAFLENRRIDGLNRIHDVYDIYGELTFSAIVDAPEVVQRILKLPDWKMRRLIKEATILREGWQYIRVMMLNGLDFNEAERYVDFCRGQNGGFSNSAPFDYTRRAKLKAGVERQVFHAAGVFDRAYADPAGTVSDYLDALLGKRGHAAESFAYCIEMASTALDLQPEWVEECILEHIAEGRADQRRLYGEDTVSLGKLYDVDRLMAETIVRRFDDITYDIPFEMIDNKVVVEGETRELGDEQMAAVYLALTQKTSILTGGPGTGKTTTVAAITQMIRRIAPKGRILMAAPTGKAAKRMQDSTGIKCYTLHRLMGLSPNSSSMMNTFGPDDILIMDELGMMDLPLAARCLHHCRDRGRVLLVGDFDQLESIEAGSVLKDLLDSRYIPAVRLTTPHRFAQESAIIQGVYSILNGYMPKFDRPNSDLHLVETKSTQDIQYQVGQIVKHEIEVRGTDPRDIQIISANRYSDAGVTSLNQYIKSFFNPTAGENGVKLGRIQYDIGDRITFQTNRYDLDLQNGDVGVIVNFDEANRTVEIDFGDRLLNLSFDLYRDLLHSWVATCHKMQGSEAQVVIIVLPKEHEHQLTRRWLFTALSRAKRDGYVVGSRQTLYKAIQNVKEHDRKNHLAFLIAEGIASKINNKLFQALGNSGNNLGLNLLRGADKESTVAPG